MLSPSEHFFSRSVGLHVLDYSLTNLDNLQQSIYILHKYTNKLTTPRKYFQNGFQILVSFPPFLTTLFRSILSGLEEFWEAKILDIEKIN